MSFRDPIWTRFLPTDTVLALARVGPLGRMKRGPGTWGSLGGVMYQLIFFHDLAPVWIVFWTLIGIWLAVAICGEAELRLGRKDPGEVVLDEFVVMPICYLGWPLVAHSFHLSMPWGVLLAGFAVFRFFDILKPLGISKLQDLPGGWGVVIDDVGAALATCGVLHLSAALWAHFHG